MIKDFLVSFTDNFKEKTKNPFLGSYLLVWLVRNWELVYTIFNFDKDCTLADKKTFISEYYKKDDFVENLLTNILWTFGLLILTYILLNISRFIVNLSDKQLTPWIYKITDSKSIVLKSEYERVRAENDDLQVRLDKERESKSRLENRIKNLETEILEISKDNSADVSNKKEEETSSESKSRDTTSSILYRKLKEQNLLKEFVSICTMINRGDAISNDYKSKDYFIEQGLIIFSSAYGSSAKKYRITSEGESVLKLARRE